MVADNIGYRLCIGSGARPTAPDGVVNLRQFIRHTIGDISAGCSTGICSKNDAVGKCYGHYGCTKTRSRGLGRQFGEREARRFT